jgi:hypothetical protein
VNESPSADRWLAAATERLSADGFSITQNVSFRGQGPLVVAHRSRFEWSKCGNLETFFVFGDVSPANATGVQQFSSLAFDLAMELKSCPLPRGLFEGVFCYAVCSTDHLDEPTAAALRSDAPTRHWAAMEMPVVRVRGSDALSFFEKTPAWGAFYWKCIRAQVNKYLAMSAGA